MGASLGAVEDVNHATPPPTTCPKVLPDRSPICVVTRLWEAHRHDRIGLFQGNGRAPYRAPGKSLSRQKVDHHLDR